MKSITWFGAILPLFGDCWIGNPRIYDFTNEGHCKVGRAQDSEHGTVDARGSSTAERRRTRTRRYTHWSRRLRKASAMNNRAMPTSQ